jgi:predicted DNA-binding protein
MARKNITSSIEIELIKRIKYLAVNTGRPLNSLHEESVRNLLEKHEKKSQVDEA